VLCCVWQLYTHNYEQLSKMSVGLGLRLAFVRLFRFSISVFFWFNLDHFVLVLFAYVVLGLVSSYAKRLAGKNVSRYSNKIESVGLRKCP